ncbi:MAG TPA: phospholipase D-like domain-containing protein [Polyangiaceae bacterium]|nr:phospholipase D-like domain-containing protein [Polyangiaceae bacterium]
MSVALKELEELVQATLRDGRLSRTERKMLDLALGQSPLPRDDLARLRERAFTLAKAQLADPHARRLIEWLEDLVAVLTAGDGHAGAKVRQSDAFFSPGDQCLHAVQSAFAGAHGRVDICVFTITDDRIAETILAAHRRGIALRIVTDNDKANDEGSDVGRLLRAGIPVRVDHSAYHMHHKFALFDGAFLLNGSYNWTRSAASNNDENLVLTHDTNLVHKFAEHFEKLWARFA